MVMFVQLYFPMSHGLTFYNRKCLIAHFRGRTFYKKSALVDFEELFVVLLFFELNLILLRFFFGNETWQRLVPLFPLHAAFKDAIIVLEC